MVNNQHILLIWIYIHVPVFLLTFLTWASKYNWDSYCQSFACRMPQELHLLYFLESIAEKNKTKRNWTLQSVCLEKFEPPSSKASEKKHNDHTLFLPCCFWSHVYTKEFFCLFFTIKGCLWHEFHQVLEKRRNKAWMIYNKCIINAVTTHATCQLNHLQWIVITNHAYWTTEETKHEWYITQAELIVTTHPTCQLNLVCMKIITNHAYWTTHNRNTTS